MAYLRIIQTASACRLVLTGDRSRGRHLVLVEGRPVWLSAGPFQTLCDLVRARCTIRTGFIAKSPMVIFRLRAQLAAGRKTESIIETGSGMEYRLTLTADQIGVDESFVELGRSNLLALVQSSEVDWSNKS